MIDITISIGDAKAAFIIDTLCEMGAYQEQVPDPVDPGTLIPNPETKGQFAKKMLIYVLKKAVYDYKKEQLTNISKQDVNADLSVINDTLEAPDA